MTDFDDDSAELQDPHNGRSTNRVRLRLRTAAMTVEVEASEAFVRDHMMDVLRDLNDFGDDLPAVEAPTPDAGERRTALRQDGPNGKLSVTTATVAARMNARTGSDLALAAAAKLTLADGRDRFNRRDLLAEMRSAGSFFRKTYASNFSNYLGTLLKDRKLIESANGVYALEAATQNEMRGELE